MAKVRVDENLKEEMKKHVKESEYWSKQSEFVNQAIRKMLKSEKDELTEEERSAIEKIVKEELGKSS